MSIRERTCITLICDSCGHDIEVDHDGVNMHYDSPEDARSVLRDEEVGAAVPDGDFCLRCIGKPHAFSADRDDPEVCARCGDEVEDHVDVEPVEVSSG